LKKVLVFGNSGSGKTTLARKLCKSDGMSHLDLDTVAWSSSAPTQRRPISESESEILAFISAHSDWVIEGCYTDLLEIAVPYSNEIIFMNLPVQLCIENARDRPWEPHKYESREAQDNNLAMLVNWIAQYPKRDDSFSQSSHERLYASFSGVKRIITSNE